MDETKTYVFGDGADKGINPALLALLNQNGGFGNGAMWLMPMSLYMMFPVAKTFMCECYKHKK